MKLAVYLLLLPLAALSQIFSKDSVQLYAFYQRLSGIYNGKPIRIYNPKANNDSFCIKKVFVNDNEMAVQNALIIEINASSTGLKTGDSIKIDIVRGEYCLPRILNTNEVIKQSRNFKLEEIEAFADGTLEWVASEEKGDTAYTVQQRRWNKWIKVAMAERKKSPGQNRYRVQVPLHSGINEFRVVRYGSPEGYNDCYSKPVNVKSVIDPVEIKERCLHEKCICFSSPTLFELCDESGKLLKSGTDTKINCRDLKPGRYYLNYDHFTDRLEVKHGVIEVHSFAVFYNNGSYLQLKPGPGNEY